MRIILRVSALLAAISLLLCAGPYGPRFDTMAFAHHRRSYVDAQDARGIGVFSTRTRQDAAQLAPDISGVWLMEKIKFALFPNKDNPLQKGDAPLQPWAEAKYRAANAQNDPSLFCLPRGIRSMYLVPTPMEIFQLPTRIIMLQESFDPPRQIYMNRQHRDDLSPTYMGDSIGKWDGDTLVVDTIGFNDKTRLDGLGLPHSEALHVIERIRRVDHETLVDDFTMEDPMAFTKTIITQQVYKLKPGWEIGEYICTENNKYTQEGGTGNEK
jgi:hypothetical protein